MPRKKLELNATSDQIYKLKQALKVGTPITIALQMAGISLALYYYWVAIYSIVVYCKEQEELETYEELTGAGISIQEIKDMSEATSSTSRKAQIGTYIEPKQESILQYKNSLKFRKFANQVYEIVNECNQIRSEIIVRHLNIINKSTDTKNKIRASGSMWFLERTQADFFGRAADKVVAEENSVNTIPAVQVEFIDPGTNDNKDRLSEMEQLVLKEMKGDGEA